MGINRRRLKGESGPEDAVAALQSLFEALLTLCRTLTAFTPFLAENIYQSLRNFFPADTSKLGLGDNLESVHYLMFPEARQEYLDPVTVRQVTRMQSVIVLGRVLRDKHTLRIKTPLKEIVIYHPDSEYLADVQSLSQYIEEELNVRQITFSNDEEKCGVKWKVDADWPVLGEKLRKDMPRVKKGLAAVTSAQVKEHMSTGKITIEGIELGAGDLTTSRFVELPSEVNGESVEADAQYTSDTDNDVVILLDIKIRSDFIQESYARELVNRVQRARKRAGCKATDDMEVYLAYSDEEGKNLLNSVLADKADVINRVLKKCPQDDEAREKSRPV